MGSAMRSFVLWALLLAAAPAWAGDELIRFRQADGTLGLVDDDDKLPPGAVVLERTPFSRPSESAGTGEDTVDAGEATVGAGEDTVGADEGSEDPGVAAAIDDESELPHEGGTFRIEPRRAAPEAEPAALDAAAAHENANLCTRYHLDSDCTESDRQVAAGWCQRSGEARDQLERAEEELTLAQEEFDRCDDVSGSYYCPRIRLDAAVSSFAKEEAAVERLENQCRKEDCLPGWTREGCEP